MMTTFDVVIATRNRLDALNLSIPLMLAESRQPQKLIIVDSSDEHELVKELISKLTKGWSGEVVVIYESAPSSSRQRNIGMLHVISDVIIFPDDDSLIFPDTFEAMMHIYERDVDNNISAVCAAESISPPKGLLNNKESYDLTLADKVKKGIAKYRYAIEKVFIPNPLIVHGENINANKKNIPKWLDDENAIAVEYMTGFRMSFRSEVIKKHQFTEVFSGYCLAEDVEASFSAMNDGVLVGARNAKIYHHRYPSVRSRGYMMGYVQMVNNAYVLSKHMFEGEKRTKRAFYVSSVYKLFLYLFAIGNKYGRDRFLGSFSGLLLLSKLLKAQSGMELDELYAQEWKKRFE